MSDIEYDPKVECLRMDAYYYGFDRTGVLVVDRILSAVATAGKAYHHTESWGDPWDENATPQVELIQRAANDAAEAIRRARREATDVVADAPDSAPDDAIGADT